VNVLIVKKFNISRLRESCEHAARGRRAVALLRRAMRGAYKLAASRRSPLSPLLRMPALEKARQRLNAGNVLAADVVEVLAWLQAAGVRAWLVGGWATDALLGGQTRAHADVDIAVEASERETARAALEREGFHVTHEAPAGRWLSLHVKMIDDLRRPVALHPIDLDAWSAPDGPGSIRQGARELGIGEIEELFATGRLAGHDVPSLSPTAQLVLRCGYDLRDCDVRDVEELCRRFGLPRPPAYLAQVSGANAATAANAASAAYAAPGDGDG
jgi:lincosamide nucleotidyltransferase A/C/D/E